MMPERRADIGVSVYLTNFGSPACPTNVGQIEMSNGRWDVGASNLCWDDAGESIAEWYSGNSRLHGRLGRD